MASNKYSKQGSYVTGAAVSLSEGWLVMTIDELVEKDIANAGVFYFKDSVLTPVMMRRFRARYCALLPQAPSDVIVIGEYGQCLMASRGGAAREEVISVNGITPESRGPLRSGTVVEQQLIVVGMDRQVYRRSATGVWTNMEAGLPTPVPEKTTGLESVAGKQLDSLYAVGWDGEIWRFDGSRWHAVVSPTNRILTSVCVDDGGTAYACGRNGLLVRGRNDQWEVLDTDCPDDLWGIASYRGEVFAASLRRLYRLRGDVLEPVDTGSADYYATFSVCAAGLWSIGAKSVASYDGQQWAHIA